LFSAGEELPGDRRAQGEQEETSHPVPVAPLRAAFLIFVEHWKANWLRQPDRSDDAVRPISAWKGLLPKRHVFQDQIPARAKESGKRDKQKYQPT
jgi:hypothetical protein